MEDTLQCGCLSEHHKENAQNALQSCCIIFCDFPMHPSTLATCRLNLSNPGHGGLVGCFSICSAYLGHASSPHALESARVDISLPEEHHVILSFRDLVNARDYVARLATQLESFLQRSLWKSSTLNALGLGFFRPGCHNQPEPQMATKIKPGAKDQPLVF